MLVWWLLPKSEAVLRGLMVRFPLPIKTFSIHFVEGAKINKSEVGTSNCQEVQLMIAQISIYLHFPYEIID